MKYGFSPDPGSRQPGPYAEYDRTDPEFAAEVQKERREYHETMDTMTDILFRMNCLGKWVPDAGIAESLQSEYGNGCLLWIIR